MGENILDENFNLKDNIRSLLPFYGAEKFLESTVHVLGELINDKNERYIAELINDLGVALNNYRNRYSESK